LTDDREMVRYLLSNTKELDFIVLDRSNIHRLLAWDALFTHHDLTKQNVLLQRALALHPSSRARTWASWDYLDGARESPNRSLSHWARQSVDPFDGILMRLWSVFSLSDDDRSGGEMGARRSEAGWLTSAKIGNGLKEGGPMSSVVKKRRKKIASTSIKSCELGHASSVASGGNTQPPGFEEAGDTLQRITLIPRIPQAASGVFEHVAVITPHSV